jgi:mono/diheme cytochrome c family protein/cytochrome c553
MKQRKTLLLLAAIAIVIGFGAMSFRPIENNISEFGDDTPLWEILEKLGMKDAPRPKTLANASIEKGKELVHKGFSSKNGKKTSRLSKFYVCTTCHNVVKEFEDPSKISAADRLDYARKNGIPYLQASTFYGIVNRNSFFNGDYRKQFEKNPDISKASGDLREAIKFCNKNFAQSRDLEEWELESILSYFWTLQFKVSDLKLSQTDKTQIEKSLQSESAKASAISFIQSKYALAMPATILKIPHFKAPDESAYKDSRRLKEGKAIFEQSCLHCHLNKKYSFFSLENELLTFKTMEKATRSENYIFSMYYLTREGLPPRMGHKSAMPLFTAEKLSPEQLESLYLYVSARAKKIYKEQ